MKAFFPGSFNPFTTGHLDLLARALRLFPDGVVVGIGVNEHKAAGTCGESPAAALRALLRDIPGVEVAEYSSLTADAARRHGAGVLVRGFRNAVDAEYERTLADANRMVAGIDTVLLPASPELGAVSSSMVRELSHFGHDVTRFLPTAEDCRAKLL